MSGEATIKDGFVILERLQKEKDLIERLIEKLDNGGFSYDPRIITRVDNNEKQFRFSNIDALADWLAGGWK